MGLRHIVLALVLSALCASFTSAQPRCKFLPGQVWKGLYRGSEQPYGGQEVTVNITGPSTWEEVTTFTHFRVAYGLSSQNQLRLKDFDTSTPTILTCPSNTLGTYNLDWTADCSSVVLTVVQDYCPRRLVGLNKIVLSLADEHTTCEFAQRSTWRGYYPDNNVLVGKLVSFRFGAGAEVTEDSTETTIITQWALNQNGNLVTSDVTGYPLPGRFLCPAGDQSLYKLTWNSQCTQVTLTLVKDSCRYRRERYNNLVLAKAATQCSFTSGSLWTGLVPGNDPRFSGRQASVSVENGMAVTTRVAGVNINNFWYVDAFGDLRTRDLSSNPSGYTCPRSSLSQYALTWGNNCTEVMLEVIRDDCLTRSNVWSGAKLTKVPASTEPPVIINFNFDKLVPPSARPCFQA
jgi:hypothetical protein